MFTIDKYMHELPTQEDENISHEKFPTMNFSKLWYIEGLMQHLQVLTLNFLANYTLKVALNVSITMEDGVHK